jgi:NSS family neurotransmitter:Na+ symporter
MEEKREKLGSRLGFILLSAGCAIGIGNVWKFPFMVGQNGGGAFVFIYLIFLLAMGIPIMTMEFSLGRAAQKSPVKLYNRIEPKGTKWHIHGYFAFVGNIILMMFYTSVTAWMLQYFFYFVFGKFESGMTNAEVGAVFDGMLSDPLTMILFVFAVVVIGFLVCSFDMQKGLESITKYMMIALLLLMGVLAVNSFTLDKAGEALSFYLIPDFSKVTWSTIANAMSQAFFTLSLGIGSMAIFGSFIGKDRALLGESVNVAVLDTFVAFTAGLIIFPAVFTYSDINLSDGSVAAGPGLIFNTLPQVFNNMWGGRVWGSLFFLFMTFAALSTIFAVFQNILSCSQDLFGWNKKKACLIDGVVIFLLSIPCILGFNIWSGLSLGELSGILDLEDYLVSNILLPGGSLVMILFCTSRYGWGYDGFIEEANTGKGMKVKRWMRAYLKYVLPVIVLILWMISLVKPFVNFI